MSGNDGSLRGRLAAARLYLCTDARESQGDLAAFLDAVLGAGVDIVQLRQKGLEAGQELRFLEVFRSACDRHGALLAVNDRADLAFAAGADVLHLGQDDLTVAVARKLLGPSPLIGVSTHNQVQAAAAAADTESDYLCAGPVWPTPTKPGRPAPGLPLIRHVARQDTSKPWFAIGGIDEATLPEVLGAGASRIVVVRVLTQAADPAGTARRLSARLQAAVS